MAIPLEDALSDAHARVVGMGERVVSSLGQARDSLFTDPAAALVRVRAEEAEIDALEVENEERILAIMAVHRPEEFELRQLMALLKINNDLERIGDYAYSVLQQACRLEGLELGGLEEVASRLGGGAVEMVGEAVGSLSSGDARRAQGVREADDRVDDLTHRLLERLAEMGTVAPDLTVEAALGLGNVARRFERAADHATNIAEDVLYWLEGEIVRHGRPRAGVLSYGDFEVDTGKREFRAGGESARLTRGEWGILSCLLRDSPEVVSRARLLKEGLGYPSEVRTRAVDQAISRLRAKMGPSRHLLETVGGHGYRISVSRGDTGQAG